MGYLLLSPRSFRGRAESYNRLFEHSFAVESRLFLFTDARHNRAVNESLLARSGPDRRQGDRRRTDRRHARRFALSSDADSERREGERRRERRS
jgi:hypothetical protein